MEMRYQYSDIGRLQYQISAANQITAYHTFKGRKKFFLCQNFNKFNLKQKTKSKKLFLIILDHVLGISDIAINHLQKTNFFSASFDNTINYYDYQNCQLLGSLKGHTQPKKKVYCFQDPMTIA